MPRALRDGRQLLHVPVPEVGHRRLQGLGARVLPVSPLVCIGGGCHAVCAMCAVLGRCTLGCAGGARAVPGRCTLGCAGGARWGAWVAYYAVRLGLLHAAAARGPLPTVL